MGVGYQYIGMAEWHSNKTPPLATLSSHTSKQVIVHNPNLNCSNLNENDILLLLHMESCWVSLILQNHRPTSRNINSPGNYNSPTNYFCSH